MAHAAEILTAVIVVVGDFNPAIVSPDWLARNELIGSDDAAEVPNLSKSLLVSREVTNFEAKIFSLQVLQNRFTLVSKDALSPAFMDLAVGILQLIPHTPIVALGLNFLGHFKLASMDEYHQVGDVLAPKDIWTSLFPGKTAGLAELTIRIQDWDRGGELKTQDEKRITLQPSEKVKPGLLLSYNDHHDLQAKTNDGLMPGNRAAKVIDEHWQAAMNDAIRVFDELIERALHNGKKNA